MRLSAGGSSGKIWYCNKKISKRQKGKFYKSVVKPTMLFGSECWEFDKKVEQRIDIMYSVRYKMANMCNNVCVSDEVN